MKNNLLSLNNICLDKYLILEKFLLEDQKLYGYSELDGYKIQLSRNFYENCFENYDVFEIVISHSSVGALISSIKIFEEKIYVLRINWLFIDPRYLSRKNIVELVEKLKEFYNFDNIIPDKIEFHLNKNIPKEHEKIFDEAGLKNLSCTSTWDLIVELFSNIIPG